MRGQRSCIYCRIDFRAAVLTAEPVLPAALGGRLALKRAVCPDCAARVRELTDDFLSTRFALTAAAMAARGRGKVRAGATSDAPASDASADDWRRAHRAAAKILYCYLLLELGQTVLSSAPSETLRRHLMGGESALWPQRWEITPPLHSPARRVPRLQGRPGVGGAAIAPRLASSLGGAVGVEGLAGRRATARAVRAARRA